MTAREVSILVIDDDFAIRENLRDLLEEEGYSVDAAENGRIGLERIAKSPPDLIVCDITMPELDGLEVLRALRSDPVNAGIPLILLTGKADRSDVRAGMNHGADDYLTKPFARLEVLEAIRTRLSRVSTMPVVARSVKSVPPQAPMIPIWTTRRPGEMFDRYRIESSLGQGGMGHVYGAYDTKLRRWVALKVLHPDLASDPSEWEAASMRLVAEARAAANLSHPNVVTVFDVGDVDGVPFLAMELVLGRTLTVAAHDAQFPQILRWLLCVAEGVAAAHDSGIVHGDVKPDNIMVRSDGRVCVLDFGIARCSAGPDVSAEATPLGTIAYMAPEQFSAWRVDGRADQFAWGVTAYEVLAGRLPWPVPRSVPALVASILDHQPASISTLVPGLPEPIGAVISRTLAKAPDARFPGMHALVAELAGCMRGGLA